MTSEITVLKFTVRFSDCDEHGRLKLSRLFQFMEEAAIADAERNGFGIWHVSCVQICLFAANLQCVV